MNTFFMAIKKFRGGAALKKQKMNELWWGEIAKRGLKKKLKWGRVEGRRLIW